jgi:hypothetical protein
LKSYVVDDITDEDLGQMVLVYNKVLVIKSSGLILFFKQEFDEDLNRKKWVLYEEFEIRGFIYHIKGNVRLQVTSDDKIYFFLIDQETLEVSLQNTMLNHMGATQMMFGKMVKYCVTYKTNERAFDIYKQKQLHGFRVPILHENLERGGLIEIKRMNVFFMFKLDKIRVFDSFTLKQIDEH